MTTKPSSAPWADEPYHLISTASRTHDMSRAYVHGANEMAHVHNTIIRGLNCIVLQAPNVPDSTSASYNAQDVKDLLFFAGSWVKMVNHHHGVEEEFMFPEIERVSGRPGLMEDPRHQHELFHGGLEDLLKYASETKPEDYRWEGPGGMKAIVGSFAGHLTDHLYAEIDTLLGLGDLDDKQLREAWDKAEAHAKATGNIAFMYDAFPVVLGASDKTYEGGNTFPPLPFILPYMIKYWFGAGNGAWRFLPCDFWGRPKPLPFVKAPES